MKLYAVSPCVDANPRRDGTAIEGARVQRNGRELQSDYLAARGEASGREQKATFRQGLTGPRLLRPANPELWPRRQRQEGARRAV